MAKIDLCFSGWVRGADIDWATNVNGEKVCVANLPAEELARKLEAGELFVSLGDYLYNSNDDAEIQLFDFEATEN